MLMSASALAPIITTAVSVLHGGLCEILPVFMSLADSVFSDPLFFVALPQVRAAGGADVRLGQTADERHRQIRHW